MKTVHNGSQLRKELLKASVLLKDDFEVILKKLTFDGFRELMARTAIDTGFARSNWSIAIDIQPADVVLKGKQVSDGSRIYPDATIPNVRIHAGSIIVLYNNTDYIIHLETGTPKMRAQPMVEPTQQMLLNVAERLVKKLSKQRYNV